MDWKIIIAGLLASLIHITFGISELLPPVIWDPYNPIFSCPDPVINVNGEDRIPFACPSGDFSFNYKQTSHGFKYNEKAYLLSYDKKEDFENCNATNSDVMLFTCNGTVSTKPLKIQTYKFSPGDFTYDKGKDYYVISTSFRKKSMLDNLVGGSCSNIENPRENKLRLRIHVCSEEEKKNGTCNVCRTESCYYKDCKTCSDWKDTSSIRVGKTTLSVFQKRKCNNNFSTQTEEQYRTQNRTCLSEAEDCWKKCEPWRNVSTVLNGRELKILQNRTCHDEIMKSDYVEFTQLSTEVCSTSTDLKDCWRKCEPWRNVSTVLNGRELKILQNRTCHDEIMKSDYVEFTQLSTEVCSTSTDLKECGKNCTQWLDTGMFQKSSENKCIYMQNRTCKYMYQDQRGGEIHEYQGLKRNCIIESAASSKDPKSVDDAKTFKIISAVLGVMCVVLTTFLIYQSQLRGKICSGTVEEKPGQMKENNVYVNQTYENEDYDKGKFA